MANDPTEPQKSEWYLTPEEASRVAKGHREMVELPETKPIAPEQKGDTEVKKMASFVESDHPRGQPDNAGQFAAKHSELADAVQTGKMSRGQVRKQHGEDAYKAVQKEIERRNTLPKQYVDHEEPSEAESSDDSDLTEQESQQPESTPTTIKEPEEINTAVDKMRTSAEKAIALAKTDFGRDLVDVRFVGRQEAKLRMAEAHTRAVELGWKPESMTTSGSLYYTKNGHRLRISDHDVPETAERKHASNEGGFSWATDGQQVNTSLEDDAILAVEEIDANLK
jgi:hypothetical protein